jgi:hypothetical protein
MIWKKVSVAYFKVSSRHLREEIDENYKMNLISIAEPNVQYFILKRNIVTSIIYNFNIMFAAAVIMPSLCSNYATAVNL